LFLAEEIIFRAPDDLDWRWPKRSARRHLGERAAHGCIYLLETLLHAQISRLSIDGISCNRDAFQQLVGVLAHEIAVFECAWLPFGAIADEVFGGTRVVSHTRPLHSGRKPRTTTPPEARLLYVRNDLLSRDR